MLLERQNNIAADAGNSNFQHKQIGRFKELKNLQMTRTKKILEHFDPKGAKPAACPKVCHLQGPRTLNQVLVQPRGWALAASGSAQLCVQLAGLT